MTGHAARVAVWLAVAAASAALLFSFFLRPIPPLVTAGLGVLGALAIWRPADAVLVLAGLGPLAAVIQLITGTPHHANLLLEAAILIVLGGAALRGAARGSALVTTPFEWAAVAFAAVALASCLAQMPVAALRGGAAGVLPAVEEVVLRRYFLERPPAYAAVWLTALLVEGAALAVLAARTAAAAPERPARLAAIVIAGGAGAAALNVHRLLEVSLRNPPFIEGLLRTLRQFRFNTQYGDLNAAGSYFAMLAVLCLGYAGWRTRRAAVCTALLPAIALALWVSGSRVALAATLLCGASLLVFRPRRLVLGGFARRTVLAGGAVLAAAFVAMLFLFPTTRHGTFAYSVSTRVELLKTGGRMLAERPLLGVGTSQFYERFPRYASPELKHAFRETLGHPVERENAHNQFLQILAELGIVGLAPFGLALFFAMRVGAGGAAPDRAAAIAALGAFLLTCLAGHPLLTPMVSCAFWLVLGLAASTAPPLPHPVSKHLARGVTLLMVLLAVSLPLRWSYERRDADLAGVMAGVSGWQREKTGAAFRAAGERAAVFVSADASMIRLPLKSADGAARRVEIRLDGRPAGAVMVAGEWIEASMPLPRQARAPAFRRIDLAVADPPPAAAPGSPLLMIGQPVEIRR